MVHDVLDHAMVYAGLGKRIEQALDFLRTTNLETLATGRHELDGTDLYASVSEYLTKPEGAGRWEAHRRYVDVQCLVRGTERIGFAPVEGLTAEPYDEQKDLLWLAGRGQFVTLEPGMFMILWPGDAHMPGMAVAAPIPAKKVVVKVAV